MNDALSTASTLPAPPLHLFSLKQCSCGVCYTPDEWDRLPLCGLQDDGEGGWLEVRNCRCGSSIAVPTLGADPTEEHRRDEGYEVADEERGERHREWADGPGGAW